MRQLISLYIEVVFLLFVSASSAFAASVSLSSDFAAGSLTIAAGDTFTTNGYNVDISTGGIDIDGILNATSGAGGDSLITTEGDWTNNGAFTSGSSTVTFTSLGTSTFTGDTTFNNLRCTTAGKPLVFTQGSTQTINGALTLTGSAGNRITLRSTSPGSQWNLDVSGTQSLSYVDVADSDASGGDEVICTNQCVEPGDNNDNWVIQLISIPTMTEWGMIIFMVLAGLVAIYYMRRQIHRSTSEVDKESLLAAKK